MCGFELNAILEIIPAGVMEWQEGEMLFQPTSLLQQPYRFRIPIILIHAFLWQSPGERRPSIYVPCIYVSPKFEQQSNRLWVFTIWVRSPMQGGNATFVVRVHIPPAPHKRRTISSWPSRTAKNKAGRLSLPTMLGSAPWPSNVRTVSTSPATMASYESTASLP